jgi:hypothetical protein
MITVGDYWNTAIRIQQGSTQLLSILTDSYAKITQHRDNSCHWQKNCHTIGMVVANPLLVHLFTTAKGRLVEQPLILTIDMSMLTCFSFFKVVAVGLPDYSFPVAKTRNRRFQKRTERCSLTGSVAKPDPVDP